MYKRAPIFAFRVIFWFCWLFKISTRLSEEKYQLKCKPKSFFNEHVWNICNRCRRGCSFKNFQIFFSTIVPLTTGCAVVSALVLYCEITYLAFQLISTIFSGDYRRNQCPVAHCIPCSVLSPSCEGKTNGIHSHGSKPWSPYYVVCYQERYISTEMCKPDSNGRTQLFHPEKNECVSLENIPREHGGMMPNCEGKADGFYLDEFGRCNMYVACKGGKFLNTVTCATGEVFDALKLACKPKKEACGPCGGADPKKWYVSY